MSHTPITVAQLVALGEILKQRDDIPPTYWTHITGQRGGSIRVEIIDPDHREIDRFILETDGTRR